MRTILLAVSLIAAPEAFPVEIAAKDGVTTAHFQGVAPSPGTNAPLVRGTTRVFFTFEGDKTALVYEPKGNLEPSDWSFDLFSPDGAHVFFLHDRLGPIHVVKTADLKTYLRGKSDPLLVLAEPVKHDESSRVRGVRWVSATELEYRVGTAKKPSRATLPAPAP